MAEPERIFEHWIHPVSEVPGAGMRRRYVATEAERQAVAKLLAINACSDITIDYNLRPVGPHKFELTGNLTANVTQDCVATLEPVVSEISEELKHVFGARTTDTSTKNEELSILESDDIEPISDGVIDVGRLAFELISAGLDPYPRKPGSTFEGYSDESDADGPNTGPLAELAKLNPNDKTD